MVYVTVIRVDYSLSTCKLIDVESIARIEWIRRNVFDIGGSSTGSERKGKHLKRQRGEGIETKNVCDVEGLQYQCSRGDL